MRDAVARRPAEPDFVFEPAGVVRYLAVAERVGVAVSVERIAFVAVRAVYVGFGQIASAAEHAAAFVLTAVAFVHVALEIYPARSCLAGHAVRKWA